MPDRQRPAEGVAAGDDPVRGIALIALGYFVISLSDAAVKWALPEVGPAMAMVWRGAFGAVAVLALTARGAPGRAAATRGAGGGSVWRAALRPGNPRLLAARSALHCVVTVGFYWAWARGMGLGDSYAVASAAPLVMTLLAVPMLGERLRWRRWTSTAVGFCGVLLMLRPGGDLWTAEAAVLLAAVALMAVTRIWTRLLARTDSPATVSLWLMAAHVPAGLLLLPAFPPPGGSAVPSGGAMLALAALGLANGTAHLLFARAFAVAPVGVLAPFEYSTLVWGTALGAIIWGDLPGAWTLAGAAVVVAAGLYNLHRERLRARERSAAAGPGGTTVAPVSTAPAGGTLAVAATPVSGALAGSGPAAAAERHGKAAGPCR